MRKSILIFSIITSFVIISCDSSLNTSIENEAITIAEDEVSYLKSAEGVDEEICAARFGGHMFGHRQFFRIPRFVLGRHFPACAEVTVSGEDFPKEIIIEYGEDCVTRRGLVKTGTITITISDTITNEGATYTIQYDNVTIGTKLIEKTATVVNEGQNEDGNWVISSESVTTITHNDSLKITREYSGVKEWLSGFGTPEIEDDKLLKSGDGTITVNDNVVFTRVITEPLFIDRTCQFILSGIVEITRNDEVMTIDFGDGTCDNLAIVTKDGVSEEIELFSGRFRKDFRRHNNNMHRHNGWW